MRSNQQFEEFREVTIHDYHQVQGIVPIIDIYIHKTGYPNTVVKAINTEERLHCWRLFEIQVTQEEGIENYPNNRTRKKNKTLVNFPGELIFSLLNAFGERICGQILQCVQNKSKELKQWCEAPITDIFIVSQKVEQKFGFKQGFIQIKSFIKRQYEPKYFESKLWQGNVESLIPRIQEQQKVRGSDSNFYSIFQKVIKTRKLIKKQKKKQP